MFKVSKSSRKVGRIFSILLGVILVIVLLKGGFVDSTGGWGKQQTVTFEGNPWEFYLTVVYLFVLFTIATMFGFVAKLKDE